MSLAKLKLSTYLWFAIIALAFITLTPVLQQTRILLMSGAFGTQRSHSDTGGQTASPNPSNSGFDQEEKVRQMLAKQYDQAYTSEKAINDFLGHHGKAADFLGYNTRSQQWLIAESKGSDLYKAVQQLQNTADGLITKVSGPVRVDVRIYMNKMQLDKLKANQLPGWQLDSADYLGYFDESLQRFEYQFIHGLKVWVLLAP